jgi:hypothetical protein
MLQIDEGSDIVSQIEIFDRLRRQMKGSEVEVKEPEARVQLMNIT